MQVCSDCGFSNEDERLFCGACGEPLKGDAKLIRDTEKLNERKAEEAKAAAARPQAVPLQGRTKADDDYVHRRTKKKDNGTDALLIILAGLAFLILVGCSWYLFKYYL